VEQRKKPPVTIVSSGNDRSWLISTKNLDLAGKYHLSLTASHGP